MIVRTVCKPLISTLLLFAACRTPYAAPQMTDQDRADVKYMLTSAKSGHPTELDFSNPVHYRFYLSQLARAGVTRAKYPQQYEVLTQSRTEHIRSGPRKVGRPEVLDTSSGATASLRSPIQTFTSFGPKGGTYTASGLSSVPNSPYVSQLTIGLYDSNQNPVGTPGFAQQYNNGADVAARTSATIQGGGVASSIITYFWQDRAGHATHGYIHAASALDPTSITNTAPMPAAGQTITTLCLARTGADCTYSPVGGTGSNVLMPVSGSITFGSAINTKPLTPNTSLITMANPDAGQGGGCTIASTTNFFASPATLINGNTISWNLAPAMFQPANNCLAVNAPAIYTFTVGLTVSNLPVYVTVTNDPNAPSGNPYYLNIPGLSVYFSCLADGTDVELRGGGHRKIEQIVAGDRVTVDQRGKAMQVRSTLRGTEEIPMIRLKTDGGHELLLTEGHPVVTTVGVVLARLLKPSDRVVTRAGNERVVSLTRERFDGHVWNLNIGEAPTLTSTSDDTTFFANGILVGDNEMQFVHNRRQQQLESRARTAALPSVWRLDSDHYETATRRTDQ